MSVTYFRMIYNKQVRMPNGGMGLYAVKKENGKWTATDMTYHYCEYDSAIALYRDLKAAGFIPRKSYLTLRFWTKKGLKIHESLVQQRRKVQRGR